MVNMALDIFQENLFIRDFEGRFIVEDYELEVCRRLRKQIYLTVVKGGQGHLASCYSCLEILYTLYVRNVLDCNKENMNSLERNRLVLSKGHAGMALYWCMCEAGLLEAEVIETFLQPGSSVGGEPCVRDLPGIESSTGSLGHGISMAVGMAIAQKLDHLDAKTYVVIGDGECEEGVVWEAAMSATAFRLDNLVVILDCNNMQKMTTIRETVGLDNWGEKWKTFGWVVREVDGHDVDALETVLLEKNTTGSPLLLIAHTVKGKGVSIMENNPLWHFKLPNRKEKKIFQSELGISDEEMI